MFWDLFQPYNSNMGLFMLSETVFNRLQWWSCHGQIWKLINVNKKVSLVQFNFRNPMVPFIFFLCEASWTVVNRVWFCIIVYVALYCTLYIHNLLIFPSSMFFVSHFTPYLMPFTHCAVQCCFYCTYYSVLCKKRFEKINGFPPKIKILNIPERTLITLLMLRHIVQENKF